MSEEKYTIEQLQDKTREILDYIDRICRENEIEYSLYFGTLLGAVRHKGYIPWDDDADICLMREEYDKFVKVVAEDNDPVFKISALETEPTYEGAYARVYDSTTKALQPQMKVQSIHGVWVDIFPLDYVYDDERKRKWTHRKKIVYHAIRGAAARAYLPDWEPNKFAKRVLKVFGSIKGSRYWASKVDKLGRSVPKQKRVTQYGFPRSKYDAIFPVESTYETVDCEFDGKIYRRYKDYDTILTALYGDYMQLPPEEKRKSVHRVEILSLGEDE